MSRFSVIGVFASIALGCLLPGWPGDSFRLGGLITAIMAASVVAYDSAPAAIDFVEGCYARRWAATVALVRETNGGRP